MVERKQVPSVGWVEGCWVERQQERRGRVGGGTRGWRQVEPARDKDDSNGYRSKAGRGSESVRRCPVRVRCCSFRCEVLTCCVAG